MTSIGKYIGHYRQIRWLILAEKVQSMKYYFKLGNLGNFTSQRTILSTRPKSGNDSKKDTVVSILPYLKRDCSHLGGFLA